MRNCKVLKKKFFNAPSDIKILTEKKILFYFYYIVIFCPVVYLPHFQGRTVPFKGLGSTPPLPTQSKKRMHTNLNCFTKSLENIFRNDQLQITNSSATFHDKNKIKVDDFSFHCFLVTPVYLCTGFPT